MADRSGDGRHERRFASAVRRGKGEGRGHREGPAEPPAPGARTERPVPTAPAAERAVLIGVGPEAPDASGVLPMLDELADLSGTAGATVVGRLWQRRRHPEPGSYLGQGRVAELAELCRAREATLVIADTDLAPAQVRHLEEAVGLRVLDRSELIIDIFATHARTVEARLQVELAQLEYLAPRLRRMWTHLSRITGAGGIGSRGPGEKQLEVDRRLVQKRIVALRQELAAIAARRSRQVRAREDAFRVALVGYTNAGKSTLMRALTVADVYVADQLFATLDTRTRRWDLGGGQSVLLSDTVGFLDKLPHHLVASFHATLEEVREASLLLHVVDAAEAAAPRRVEVVRAVLREIGAGAVPERLVLNQCDRVRDPVELQILAGRLGAELRISALTGEGLENLAAVVRGALADRYVSMRLSVPAADGRTLAEIRRHGRVLDQSYEGDQAVLSAVIPRELALRLAPFAAERRIRNGP